MQAWKKRQAAAVRNAAYSNSELCMLSIRELCRLEGIQDTWRASLVIPVLVQGRLLLKSTDTSSTTKISLHARTHAHRRSNVSRPCCCSSRTQTKQDVRRWQQPAQRSLLFRCACPPVILCVVCWYDSRSRMLAKLECRRCASGVCVVHVSALLNSFSRGVSAKRANGGLAKCPCFISCLAQRLRLEPKVGEYPMPSASSARACLLRACGLMACLTAWARRRCARGEYARQAEAEADTV